MSFATTGWAWPWWAVMVSINIVNLVVCAIVFKRSRIPKDGTDTKYRKWMRIMGITFTLVAAYRVVFVSRYGTQRAWFDSLANSSLLIRSFATVAELAFAGLIALAMLRFNTYLPPKEELQTNKFKSFMTTKTPYVLVICIFLAQFFATSSVITKLGLLGAIEETLWSIGFLSVLPLAFIQLRRVLKIKDEEEAQRFQILKVSAIIIAAWCLVYCCYGVFYHIPGIWRWVIQDLQSGWPTIKTGLSAIIDAFTIVNPTRMYSDWGWGFLFWHSAYFSVCAWISLFLMQAPRPRDIPGTYNKKLTTIIITLIPVVIITLVILFSIPAFT